MERGEYQLKNLGCFHVQKDGNWVLVDGKGKILLECEYENIHFVFGNMTMSIIPVKKDGKWGSLWLYPKFEGLLCVFDKICLGLDHFFDSIVCIKDGKERLFNCFSPRCDAPQGYGSLRRIGDWGLKYPYIIAKKWKVRYH